MFFEIAVATLILGSYVYHRWIEDHPSPDPNAVSTPRVNEGSSIPLIYGTIRIRAPVMVWAGSERTLFIQDKIAYFVDMLYVVGIPFYGGGAVLTGIYAGDVFLTLLAPFTALGETSGLTQWPVWFDEGIAADRSNYYVNNIPARLAINNDIQTTVNIGFVEFHSGTPGQRISDRVDDFDKGSLTDTQGVLEARPMNDIYPRISDDGFDVIPYPDLPQNILASNVPSYRNQALACLYHWCNGTNTQLISYNFVVRSLSTGLSADLGRSLPDDADPAAVLYDLFTSKWGKLALSSTKIDLPSFQAASLTLFNEGHGYSRSIEEAVDATEIIDEIMRQTDGVYYEEPTTGRIVYRLIRNDYSLLGLDDVNPDTARPGSGSWISVAGWSETLNQVRITFTDRENNYADGLAIGQDFANFVSQGAKLRSVDIRFPGCCTRTLAAKLASRELAAVSRPLVKATVMVNRSFYLKRPGDVVTFTWPQLGINKMVMRIARVDLGQLHNGEITLDLLRDAFDVSVGAFPVA